VPTGIRAVDTSAGDLGHQPTDLRRGPHSARMGHTPLQAWLIQGREEEYAAHCPADPLMLRYKAWEGSNPSHPILDTGQRGALLWATTCCIEPLATRTAPSGLIRSSGVWYATGCG
jgi:hypothetical protein